MPHYTLPPSRKPTFLITKKTPAEKRQNSTRKMEILVLKNAYKIILARAIQK